MYLAAAVSVASFLCSAPIPTAPRLRCSVPVPSPPAGSAAAAGGQQRPGEGLGRRRWRGSGELERFSRHPVQGCCPGIGLCPEGPEPGAGPASPVLPEPSDASLGGRLFPSRVAPAERGTLPRRRGSEPVPSGLSLGATYVLQPQVGFHYLVDFVLEKRRVSGEAPALPRCPAGQCTHHLHQLRHGHLELDDDRVRDVLDGAYELVVALEEGRVEPVLGLGAATACGGHGVSAG